MNAENKFKEYVLKNDYYDYTSYISLVEDSIQGLSIPGYFSNSFCAFNSIHNICYLIYKTNKNSIISFNITANNKINEIVNAHSNLFITLNITKIKLIIET